MWPGIERKNAIDGINKACGSFNQTKWGINLMGRRDYTWVTPPSYKLNKTQSLRNTAADYRHIDVHSKQCPLRGG